MSRWSRYMAALDAATAGPWLGVTRAAATDTPIGGFDRDADTEFAVAARDVAADVADLVESVRPIHARSLLGLTYIRSAERKRLRDLFAKLDA